MTSEALKAQSRKALGTLARRKGITGWHSMTKDELIRSLMHLERSKSANSSRGTTSARRSSTAAARKPPATSRRVAASGKRPEGGTKKRGNGNPPLPRRGRDLTTTEIDDVSSQGRTNFIDARVSDATWLRVEWDLTRDSIRRAESRLASDWHRAIPVLRMFELSADDGTPVTDIFVKDVVIDAGVNTWYVNVPEAGKPYRLHVGYRTDKGAFFAVAKSNVCTTPSLSVSQTTIVNGKAQANGKGQAAGKAGTNGPDRNGEHRNGSSERGDDRLGRPLGFSSLAHFGPAATEERINGEFSFKLDTELIIHGATRPGSGLTVQGEPVELRDDGSFTIRINQPEGRQVITFTAMSPRGSERRMVVLGMERNTKELERQYFDGGHPEGFAE
jgi:hypothetical protein